MIKITDLSVEAKELIQLAEDWRTAARREAFGWGAGSPSMADINDTARARFSYALRNAKPKTIQEICSALMWMIRDAE